MNISRLTTYIRQFNPLGAVKFIVFDIFRKLLNPACIPSYSQTGEDRLIANLLGDTSNGFFVDVGCNEPRLKSNTFAFYAYGWSGINIDANAKLINKFSASRPRDVSICAAVSSEEKTLVFTEFDDPLVSSLDASHVNEWKNHRTIASQTSVVTTPLSKILEQNNVPASFDLLSIDVEGHDFEVLHSLDFEKYHPRLIVIEIHGLDFLNPYSNPIYQHLTAQGYRMVAYAIMNGYFMK
jgi:FkbM family methyltransferase